MAAITMCGPQRPSSSPAVQHRLAAVTLEGATRTSGRRLGLIMGASCPETSTDLN